MRAFTILAIAATLLATLAASDAAINEPGASTAKHTLNGWRQFKFGMTPEQARAVPGVSWRPGVHPPTVIAMVSLPMTSEYGPNTHVMLMFNSDQKLTMINLSISDTESAADCEKTFQNLLTRLDAKHGAFAPGGEKDQWAIRDALIQGAVLERTSALKLSGSRSRYWHRTILPNVSGLNLEEEAKHSFGSRWLELMMYQKDGKTGCNRSITFTADIPSKAQLEVQFKLSRIPTNMDWHWAEVDRLGRGLSSGPAQTVFSTGTAEHVRLSGGRFTADVISPPGSQRAGTVHLVGTISNNKISAHVPASEAVADDFPTSFEGSVSMFTTDGEPVDTYEISLTGNTRWSSTTLGMAAYHRNSPHTPTPEACRGMTESVFATRRTPREMTYWGLLQALGCPPP